jgi:phosphoenolpyruvate carboxykinase (ATP)
MDLILQARRQLERLGIERPGRIHLNLTVDELYEMIETKGEGVVANCGAVVVNTGKHTGRSALDKFIVVDSVSRDKVNWGASNQPIESRTFDELYRRVTEYLVGKDIFVKDLFVCAHPGYRMPVRVITELAWHSLFAHNLFIRPDGKELVHDEVGFTVVDVPGFLADPKRDGTRTDTFVILSLERRIALIGGTAYAGEMKKSVFSALNFYLPDGGVFPMHCSANTDRNGNVALFFGLSGTGKTTLSADPERWLIGDDEHGWFDGGIFNFEGGCYAKVIRLSPESEPDIYRASTRYGTILENVVLDPETGEIDFDSDAITENTRSAYPITHLNKIVPDGCGGEPDSIFMLTYDAFGVLPPVARLTKEQALYYFLLGYTAKVAGTERGVSEPQATFSACFGAPFLPRHPMVYAKMLEERLGRSGATCWLLNTGITGGPYGVGKRIPLKATRAIVKAALDGTLERGNFKEIPIFGLQIPLSCPGVDDRLLEPRRCWTNPEEYDSKAIQLASLFKKTYMQYKS